MDTQFPVNKAKDVLLDTNIVQYFFRHPNDLAPQILQHLEVAKAIGSILAISDITIYELVTGSNINTEAKALKAIEGLKQFSIDKDLIIASARMSCLYKEFKGRKVADPEIGDNLIAATCLLRDCILYSCDKDGFPEPFFKKIDNRELSFLDKNGDKKTIMAYFVIPDPKMITEEHQKRQTEMQFPETSSS